MLYRLSLLLFLIPLAFTVVAQRTAKVTGKYTYILTENDDVTIKEAKIKAVELAKAEAIKNEFGTLVVSDFINTERSEGNDLSSYYIMDTTSSMKGEWLGDEREPEIDVNYVNGEFLFTAEVWGTAREIKRVPTDIRWEILKDAASGEKTEAEDFDSGERFFVKFKSPADGYVAIYLITGDDETACLLPYRKDKTGRVPVKGGKEYTFFDMTTDPQATYYKLNTRNLLEHNQLVVIYSPNPFSMCVDTNNDNRRLSYLKQKDFAKWLLKNQRADNDMVVNRKWISIKGKEENLN